MSIVDFEAHGYAEPTIVAPGANNTTFKVSRYNHDIHGPYPEERDRPEGDLLGNVLKHVILTCEENISNTIIGISLQRVLVSSGSCLETCPPKENSSQPSTTRNLKTPRSSSVDFWKRSVEGTIHSGNTIRVRFTLDGTILSTMLINACMMI